MTTRTLFLISPEGDNLLTLRNIPLDSERIIVAELSAEEVDALEALLVARREERERQELKVILDQADAGEP